jgi:thiamine-phosphate pyrophosphorylase
VKEFFEQQPLIYLITDGQTTANNFSAKLKENLQIIETAVDTGIQLIQIREKNLPARLIFQLTTEVCKITKYSNTKVLVNDRADIALAVNADGVHLTSKSIPTEIIRQNFPKEFIIGVSTHSLATAQKAQINGANFITYSPIFYSPNKGEPQGLKNLHEICKKLESFPVIALGGVDETNYLDILKNGASGWAAIRFLNNWENLRKLKRKF